MTDFFKKHTLITGTLLLTMTGFLTRFLGFFYRIFLSRTIGAEGLGIYNMVHPIFGICFALCAGSIQTAVSRFVAANTEKGKAVFRTVRAAAAVYGGFGAVFGDSCLYQRVLLWDTEDEGAGIFPGD